MTNIKSLRAFRATILAGLSFLMIACGGAPAGGTSGVGSGNDAEVIEFTSNSEDQLVLKGQGGVETSIVSFLVTDVTGSPIRGRRVDFSLSTNVGGIAFVGGDSATTNASGAVSVIVESGSVPATVQVAATIDGTTRRAVSSEIAVSTSTFSASSFELGIIVTENNSPGANGATIVASVGELGGIDVELQMIVTDQFGHKVLDGSRINFVAPEGGLFEPSTCEVSGGICRISWISPIDVGVGGRVTLIAYANGAEAFDDLNSNNVYELNETFTDLGEAYADENENGVRDAGEFFVDANQNGMYDATGNGVWDGPCVGITGESQADMDARCLGRSSTILWDTTIIEGGPIP